ncbi:hypothetical protein [Alteromonas antoniana]|uniref:hypothetical protein n=1 Tax=Alteromonas antoniana TaxID=2803813 RepID=UPI001C485F98|nr:hypothetical protein [Alteromonas antoniana]
MIKGVSLLLSLLFLMSCSPRPAYQDVISTFQDNRPTFTMIASLACDIGKRSQQATYEITGENKKEEELLALAQSVDIDAITVVRESERCRLSMPVWEATDDTVWTRYAYRYNVKLPHPYLQEKHDYQQITSSVSQKRPSSMGFDMKLSRKWFFSFKASHINP